MPSPLCVQPLVQTGPLSCAVTALAMYLGLSSVADLRARAMGRGRPWAHWERALSARQLRALAQRYGVTFRSVRVRDGDDLDEATGLLLVTPNPLVAGSGYHWVVVIDGVVVNPADGLVHQRREYLAHRRPVCLLTETPHPD